MGCYELLSHVRGLPEPCAALLKGTCCFFRAWQSLKGGVLSYSERVSSQLRRPPLCLTCTNPLPLRVSHAHAARPFLRLRSTWFPRRSRRLYRGQEDGERRRVLTTKGKFFFSAAGCLLLAPWSRHSTLLFLRLVAGVAWGAVLSRARTAAGKRLSFRPAEICALVHAAGLTSCSHNIVVLFFLLTVWV